MLVSVACGVSDSLPWPGDGAGAGAGAGAGEGLREFALMLMGGAADAVDAANANVDAADAEDSNREEAETDVVGSAQARRERPQKMMMAHDQGRSRSRRFCAECRMTP